LSTEDIDDLIAGNFSFLLEESPCALREVMLRSVRRTLERLDGLDREHPVWSLLAVQTVNRSRLRSYTGWQVHYGEADEATDLAIVAQDLAAGSCISTEAWSRLASRSSAWRLEGPLIQGFFNYHLFDAGTFMNDLKRHLVEHDQVAEALAYLRRPEAIENLCFRWLTPTATAADLLTFANLIDLAA
jgi:hypothetical protein